MKERYALVKFRPYGYEYTYKCDKSVKKGNIVLVPGSGDDERNEVIVSKIKYLCDDELPVSKDRIKSVSSIVSEKDDQNQFYENLDERYAFKQDDKIEKYWVKKRKYDIKCEFEEMSHKYTLINKLDDARLSVFSDGEKFMIHCHIGSEGYDFALKEDIKCFYKQEVDYILNELKIAINNYYSCADDDEFDIYYMQGILRDHAFGHHG